MKYFFTLVLTLSINIAFSQLFEGVRFKKLIHDFGNVREESESVSYVFSFKNTSNTPIKITKVETSCGCTTPTYTMVEIKPGDTGFVKATYGTRGRPNRFNKNLFVYFNETRFQTLNIIGNVISQSDLSKKPDEYTVNYANLAFNQNLASFPSIYNYEKKEATIKIFNYNGYDIKILSTADLPDYITLDLKDSMLRKDDSLFITIKVDGSKITKIGGSYSTINLLTDDISMEKKPLYVYTYFKVDYTKLSKEQLKVAPKMEFNKSIPIKYGKKTAGSIVKDDLKITNTGKTDLIFTEIKVSCSCVSFTGEKKVLKPGESMDLKILIDTVNQTKAYHKKYISLQTNDPSKPEYNIILELDII